MFDYLKHLFNFSEDAASEDEVIDSIRKGIDFKGANLWTLILAIVIASVGLNVNSAAVIIGAMLISPLMGPIMGVGLGAGIFDPSLIKVAAKNLLTATIIGLLTSTIYFTVSPLTQAQSELLARVQPTIYDVMIAFTGGLAGMLAHSRKKFNNVIPGVAIATALMPPLCTAGFGLATGHYSYFFGAIYLYIINSVFISIATFIVVRFLKYHSSKFVDAKLASRIRKTVWAIAILTIIPSIYLAYVFVSNEIFIQRVNEFIGAELTSKNFLVVNQTIDPAAKKIQITLLHDANTDSINVVLNLKKEQYKLGNTSIVLQSSENRTDFKAAFDQLKDELKENVLKKQEEELVSAEAELKQFRQQEEQEKQFENQKADALDEFNTLFGKTTEFLVDKSILQNSEQTDTVLFVYFIPEHPVHGSELQRIENWLSAKFKISRVKLIQGTQKK